MTHPRSVPAIRVGMVLAALLLATPACFWHRKPAPTPAPARNAALDVPEGEIEYWEKHNDPVSRFEKLLLDQKIADRKKLDAITADVMRETRRRLQGVRWGELPMLWDVDRPEDLLRLRSLPGWKERLATIL